MDLHCVDTSFCRRRLPVSACQIVKQPEKHHRIGIIGAGVSGLTCGVLFSERGFHTEILAEQIGQQTTSGAAAALWFPYDAEPADKVIPWALATYKVLVDLAKDPGSGVSLIELRQYCRSGKIEIPDWASSFVIPSGVEGSLNVSIFKSGFEIGRAHV